MNVEYYNSCCTDSHSSAGNEISLLFIFCIRFMACIRMIMEQIRNEDITYSKLALCSIWTISPIAFNFPCGMFSQWLNASANLARTFFPGICWIYLNGCNNIWNSQYTNALVIDRMNVSIVIWTHAHAQNKLYVSNISTWAWIVNKGASLFRYII